MIRIAYELNLNLNIFSFVENFVEYRFVRCADLKSSGTSGLDISPAAQFHQSTMYWQHPHLPWLTLFPRMSKANIGCQVGEAERTALARDWSDSFRALFQVRFNEIFPFFSFTNLSGYFDLFSLFVRCNVHIFMYAQIHLRCYFERLVLVAKLKHMHC